MTAPTVDRDRSEREIADLAAACVDYVERATGFRLDFTVETLPVLDHYLTSSAAPHAEVVALVARSAGAYIGEVVCRLFGARWHAPHERYEDWRVEFEDVFLFFNPIAFAFEALRGEEVTEGGAGFGVLDHQVAHLRASLDALGAVDPTEYRKPSVRLEVLEAVLDKLRNAPREPGEQPAVYSSEAYRTVLDGEAPVARG